MIVCTLLYITVLNWTYRGLVVPAYEFWGFSINPTPWAYLLVSWVVCMIPSFWMPVTISRPSQLLFLIQYYFIFIPACFILYDSSNPILVADDVLIIILLMLAGLSIIESIYYLPLIRTMYFRLKPYWFWFVFFIGLIILIGYTIITLRGNFRLVALAEIYSVRSSLVDMVEATGTRFGIYALTWLSGFFLPFCFAVGVFSKRWWLIAIAGCGYLLLSGIGGTKSTLLAFIFFPLIFIWVTYARKYAIPVFVTGLCLLLSLGALLQMIGLSIIALWYVSIVNFRTFSIPALLIAQFHSFFSSNPLTYLSHVTGINFLITYPYDTDIPSLVGIYFRGYPIGANAGFWAGDGLAGFGPPGIVIVSFICALLFWVFDSVSRDYNPRFVVVTLTFIAAMFANIGLSTMMVTGGLWLLILTLFTLPEEGILRVAFRNPSTRVVQMEKR